ncbi:uncharacterized protein LOC134541015 isoform X2 [Bacillus rossius redtenbacheri]|uniref:uncharacterized protein LOC134541015 isoform X2 n=1 Tax=Bacillus rossius redtenbacheri TaxID=93214 RepID=UPI002FDD14C0
MNSPKLGNKHSRESGKLKQQLQASQSELSDGEELSPSQILELVKPDRVTASKPEEDRRRRTIIVEKHDGSFGFTLQSYGIHYKKEQEIEMITYVDFVDYDGAAFRAGMREGDVILSINGHDMEKADHKTLVNYIKNCDCRMRMVVLFEDCVRKVELHMRYIQLQRVLQGKMAELERLCLRERELLQGKWKTHSLPARSKKASASTSTDASTPTHQPADYNYCRPTVSTEDVARAQPPVLAYQCLDPLYGGYCLQRSADSSGEYLVAWPAQRGHAHGDPHARHSAARGYHQTNGVAAAASAGSRPTGGGKATKSAPGGQLCNPCVQAGGQDNSSLEAYDLASPCCDPHCVPTRRRARHKEHRGTKPAGKSHEARGCKEKSRSGAGAAGAVQGRQPAGHYLDLGPAPVSQCSLHSCTSSEQNGAEGESSAASYTTSLSTDTLYWDAPCEVAVGRSHSGKVVCGKHGGPTHNHLQHQHQHQHQHQPHHQHQQQLPHHYNSMPQHSASYNPAKPAKSWDNLTTKAFGGYGFGYGYLDVAGPKGSKGHGRAHSAKGGAVPPQPTRSVDRRVMYGHQPRYVQPTKSTESLLLLQPRLGADALLSDSSLSCDCLDAAEQFHNKASQTDGKRPDAEVTRL